MDDVREKLERLIGQSGLNLRSASAKIGRGPTYLHDFINKGSPKQLPEEPRRKLAKLLKVDEAELMPPHIARLQRRRTRSGDNKPAGEPPVLEGSGVAITIPEYDVRASMGGGFFIDAESVRGYWPFDRSYLVNELRLTPGNLVVIEVIGDSMEPTLRSGDRVLVDMSDQRVGIPGVFVLFDGDGTVAKRVEKIPDSDPAKVRLISDNQHHGSYEVLGEHVNIVGRVVWFARRM